MLTEREALDAVEGVLEAKGLEIIEVEDMLNDAVCFELPNQHGGICPGRADFVREIGVLQINVQLFCDLIEPLLFDGLPLLLLGFQQLLVGSTFNLYPQDTEDGLEVEVEVSVSYLVIPDQPLDAQATRMIEYLAQCTLLVIPALYQYLGQRLRVKVTTDGQIKSVQCTVTVPQALSMIRLGTYGRA